MLHPIDTHEELRLSHPNRTQSSSQRSWPAIRESRDFRPERLTPTSQNGSSVLEKSAGGSARFSTTLAVVLSARRNALSPGRDSAPKGCWQAIPCSPDADPVGFSGVYYANHQRAHTRLMPKNRSWDLEDQVRRKLIAEGRYTVDAAVEVNRSEAAVRLRAKLFGLSLLQRREAKGRCDIQYLTCHPVEARPHISVPNPQCTWTEARTVGVCQGTLTSPPRRNPSTARVESSLQALQLL
jgi:hypothetical protein